MDVYHALGLFSTTPWGIGDNRGTKQAQGTPGYPESRSNTTGYTMGSYPEQCDNSRSSVEARIRNEESISTPYGAALHEPVEELAAKEITQHGRSCS